MFSGSIVAIVTPMRTDGAIDWDAFSNLIDWHVQQRTDAVVVAGTTGESATLTHSEHCSLIEYAVKHAGGRLPVVAGSGSNSTAEAIELTAAARQAGADACLVVCPYYNRPTQDGLYLHHKAIADAVSVPQILYNVPSRTSCDMLPETVAKLSRVPNIIGIKEATADLKRSQTILSASHRGFIVLSGDDATAFDLMLEGASGVISVSANIAPKAMHDLCQAVLDKKLSEAKRINDLLMPLNKVLFVEPNPIPAKWALYKLGFIADGIRLPLTRLSPQHHDSVQRVSSQFHDKNRPPPKP